MPVNLYASTDAAAPTLTGELDTLNAILDAILIDGYGTQPAAGWTREYRDATSRINVYRPAAGPRHYLQVNDNAPGAHGAREARLRGYVSMSAYDTGTEPFPTVTQLANGYFCRKSAALSTTPRDWYALADDATLYLFINPGDAADQFDPYTFGATNSWKPNDAYATLIAGRITEASSLHSTSAQHLITATALGTAAESGYTPRPYTGVGTSTLHGTTYASALIRSSAEIAIGSGAQPYPLPVDASLLLSPLYLDDGTLTRGTIPGLWMPAHARPLATGQTYTAQDGAITRTFMAINTPSSGQMHIETSDTWYD